jgi:hypothetical protein
MFERHNEPLVTWYIFLLRLLRSTAAALFLIVVSLVVGMLGYHKLAGLSWIDSYMEAAMILSGMGPTAAMHSTAAKIFSGMFALYSGLMLVIILGVIIAPIAHRFFHRFHLAIDNKDS